MKFTVFCKPVPQGSMKGRAFVGKDGKLHAAVYGDNNKTLPYRQQIAQTAMVTFTGPKPAFASHYPVSLEVDFYFHRPKSAKHRTFPSVKPDLDKLVRAVKDALKGIAYEDDGQVVQVLAAKLYTNEAERTEIVIRGIQ